MELALSNLLFSHRKRCDDEKLGEFMVGCTMLIVSGWVFADRAQVRMKPPITHSSERFREKSSKE